MKKFLVLSFICFIQTIWAQTIKSNSKATNTSHSVDKKESLKNQNTDKNTIYDINSIDIKPDFDGGINKFQKFIRNNYFYREEWPELSKRTIEVNFVVEKDGTISDIKVTKDAGYSTGAEAIRILKKSPKWIPGTLNNKLVRVRYYLTIPINTNHE